VTYALNSVCAELSPAGISSGLVAGIVVVVLILLLVIAILVIAVAIAVFKKKSKESQYAISKGE
jgi:flagellar basal body-associated protein FliL